MSSSIYLRLVTGYSTVLALDERQHIRLEKADMIPAFCKKAGKSESRPVSFVKSHCGDSSHADQHLSFANIMNNKRRLQDPLVRELLTTCMLGSKSPGARIGTSYVANRSEDLIMAHEGSINEQST